MEMILLYILAGSILLLCIIPCEDVCERFYKSGKDNFARTFLYGAAVYFGMMFWLCVMGLLLYLVDNVYRSGLIFMLLFIAVSAVFLMAGNLKRLKTEEDEDGKKKKKATGTFLSIFMAAIWITAHLICNYLMNIVLSTAFFMSGSRKLLYVYLMVLFMVGAFIMFSSWILVNPDRREFEVHFHDRKKEQNKVYVPKAARNMINHSKKKKRKR